MLLTTCCQEMPDQVLVYLILQATVQIGLRTISVHFKPVLSAWQHCRSFK